MVGPSLPFHPIGPLVPAPGASGVRAPRVAGRVVAVALLLEPDKTLGFTLDKPVLLRPGAHVLTIEIHGDKAFLTVEN